MEIVHSQRWSDPILPQTCLCKEVRGYLTRCAQIAASVTLNDNIINHSLVSRVGKELLEQLKKTSAPPCPTPNNFSSALPCPAPKQKKAAPCIPDEHVGLLDQNKRLRMMTFYRPDGLGAQMWPEITCRILLHRHQVNDLGMIRSKKDQRSATRRC